MQAPALLLGYSVTLCLVHSVVGLGMYVCLCLVGCGALGPRRIKSHGGRAGFAPPPCFYLWYCFQRCCCLQASKQARNLNRRRSPRRRRRRGRRLLVGRTRPNTKDSLRTHEPKQGMIPIPDHIWSLSVHSEHPCIAMSMYMAVTRQLVWCGSCTY